MAVQQDHRRQWLEALDPELSDHLRSCRCPCDHIGLGNYYFDDQVPRYPRDNLSPVQDTSFDGPQYYNGFHGYYHSCDIHGSIETCSYSSESSSTRPPLQGPWFIRAIVCILVVILTVGLSLPLALTSKQVLSLRSAEERLEIVKTLLAQVPLIDGHNDLPWNLRKFVHNRLIDLNLSTLSRREPWSSSKWSHTDIRRLRAGLVGGQFWSAYVPCKAQHSDAVQITLEQIDVIKRFVEYNSDAFAMARSKLEIQSVHRGGRIASLIGVEGGHALGNSLAVLRTFYNLGARYLTITHNCDTAWATGSRTRSAEGLSEFGENVIREMNRLGMIIDLSHASVQTAKSALNVSKAPVIFSHSSAYALCNSSRNVDDDVLKLIAHYGGVVMVNFYNLHVTCNETATVRDVIDHINHIRSVAGVDHVGIGAGYDGINMTPSGLEDVSRYPDLLAELLADPAWSERDIVALAGSNLLRVFERVESVRNDWKRAEVPPFEDFIPPVDGPCSSLYS